jgi:type IV secretory pathway TrbD component
MALRRVPIYRSGHRHNLFMGGDRELVMFSALVAAALVFCAQEWLAALFGVSLWTAALWCFRKMAKADPLQRHVYMRHRRYRAYYPPRSTPFRVNTSAQGRQYQ